MKWYAITGVVEGQHYHYVFQAASMSHAEKVFTDYVFRTIAEEYYHDDPENYDGDMEKAVDAVYEDHSAPWILAMVRSPDKPEFLYGG